VTTTTSAVRVQERSYDFLLHHVEIHTEIVFLGALTHLRERGGTLSGFYICASMVMIVFEA
jgi:hypothetical protein